MRFLKKPKAATAKRPGAVSKQKRQVGLGTLVSVAAVVAVAAFIAGTRMESVVAWFGGSRNAALPNQLDLSSVQQVYEKLRQQFDGDLGAQKLIEGAKKRSGRRRR